MRVNSRTFLLGSILLLSGFLCSCEGSFGPMLTNALQPPPGSVISKSGWFHHKDNLDVVGVILPAVFISNWSVTRTSKVVVGWEIGSPDRPKLLFTNFTNLTQQIDPTYGTLDAFMLHLADSLPLDAIVDDGTGVNKLAIGHIFLVDDSRIVNMQIIPYDSLTTFNITGAVDQTAILFREGEPMFYGLPLLDSYSRIGYNVFLGVYGDAIDPYRLTGFSPLSASSILLLTADGSTASVLDRNRIWLGE